MRRHAVARNETKPQKNGRGEHVHRIGDGRRRGVRGGVRTRGDMKRRRSLFRVVWLLTSNHHHRQRVCVDRLSPVYLLTSITSLTAYHQCIFSLQSRQSSSLFREFPFQRPERALRVHLQLHQPARGRGVLVEPRFDFFASFLFARRNSCHGSARRVFGQKLLRAFC